ncbi:hypothetical protein UlMin_027201 [Ulmus minor]
MEEKVLYLGLEESELSFNLEKAVCNHGFFMMPPNRWNSSDKTLQRPLRLSDGQASLTVSISHPPNLRYLLIHLQNHPSSPLSSQDHNTILEQVRRMLRITERDERDVREFHKVCPQAKEKGFGRVFRSPSLFEDAVKSILLCNCTWTRTLQMAQALCDLQLELTKDNKTSDRKRKRGKNRKPSKGGKCKKDDSELTCSKIGNFPTSKELASIDEIFLENNCPILGYRAKYILKLAKHVENGKVRLDEIEKLAAAEKASIEQVYRKLMNIDGFGSFVSANVLMCIRHYQRIPADTETIRHLQQVHGRKECNKKNIQQEAQEIYEKYAPFQCLAYWMELLDYYENKFGKLSDLPESSYGNISGRLKPIGN